MGNWQGRAGTGRRRAVELSRRGLLNGGLALGAAALGPRLALAQAGGGHVHMPELGVAKVPVVPAMDQPLVEPEARRSANGVLSTSLRCAYAYRDIGGKRLYLRSYEGGSPGPTLRMKPGETLKIRLTNDFPPNRDLAPQDLSRPHQFNNTNFHFHGAHCSPNGIADNVMRTMLPGKSYAIEITLPAAQARERVMVLAHVVFDVSGMVEDFYTVFPDSSTRFLAINGQRRPTIDMRPGEVQRWRLV